MEKGLKMNVSAILTGKVNLFNKKQATLVKPPKIKPDTYEKTEATLEYTGKDKLEKDTFEIAKYMGFNDAELKYLIKMAKKITGSPFFSIGLCSMLLAQEDFEFKNVKQLVTFNILETSTHLDDKDMVAFAQNDDYVKAFFEITQMDKDETPSKVFDIYESTLAQDAYNLIVKTGNDKKKLDAVVQLYTQVKSSKHLEHDLYKDWVERLCEYINDNKNFRKYNKTQQAIQNNKPIIAHSLPIGPSIRLLV